VFEGTALWVGRALLLAVLVGGGVVFWLRQKARRQAFAAVPRLLEAFAAAFRQGRAHDESEPTCVVAFHRSFLGLVPIVVGVTAHRVVVLKGNGSQQTVPYDHEGEHLPSAQKSSEKRGFFHWMHDQSGYCPRVQQRGSFQGEQWSMPIFVPGYSGQKEGLRAFSRLFYFKWFYE
jgi:hypothetical protein